MALDDILSAIAQHARQQLDTARSAHGQRIKQMREQSAQQIERTKREITEQKEQKIRNARQKVETHTAMHTRNAVLEAKQSQIERAYAETIAALAKLPEKQLEPLMRACLDGIPSSGEIRPAHAHAALLKHLAKDDRFTIGKPIDAAGGFRFVSGDREVDCTLEALVRNVLRPATELETCASLFRSRA